METEDDICVQFLIASKLDLKNLDAHDVRLLLELLPRVLVYLHTEYDPFEIDLGGLDE